MKKEQRNRQDWPSRSKRIVPCNDQAVGTPAKHIQITTDPEVLLKWLDKTKLFIERGYRESALQLLKRILHSVEEAPDLFPPQPPPEATEEEAECDLVT
jgi:hypothetical protein